MMMAKFRDHVRSKSDIAMVNESLCHNIGSLIQEMYELGIEPEFCALQRMPAQTSEEDEVLPGNSIQYEVE